MRGDLQVDKGNGVRWGFGREESWPDSGKYSVEVTSMVANSKTSEKTKCEHPWQSPA